MEIAEKDHVLHEQIVVRHLLQDDLAALEWEGEYIHFRKLYREIYQGVCEGKALMWVAELPDREIVGQIFVQLDSSRSELADGKTRAYVYGFRVKRAYQGAGIGTKLLRMVENDLMQRKFEWISLNVSKDNLEARQLYKRLGYTVVGTDPGQWSYYDHQGNKRLVNEPAWRMLKRLGSAQ